jgi:hypothetical protein
MAREGPPAFAESGSAFPTFRSPPAARFEATRRVALRRMTRIRLLPKQVSSTSRSAAPTFSLVWMLLRIGLPRVRPTPPPSLRANSAGRRCRFGPRRFGPRTVGARRSPAETLMPDEPRDRALARKRRARRPRRLLQEHAARPLHAVDARGGGRRSAINRNMSVRAKPWGTCVQMPRDSSKSLGGTAVAAARPSSRGSVQPFATAPPCQKRPIGGNFHPHREPNPGYTKPKSTNARMRACVTGG